MRSETPSTTASGAVRQKIVLAVLVLLALASVFVLPSLVDEPWLLGDAATSEEALRPPPTGAESVAPSTAAEKTRYRQESQAVLAEVIALRDRLRDQGVERWGEVAFNLALDRVSAGDERYGYGEYEKALDDYRAARDDLRALEAEGKQKLETALADGNEAVENLNANVARAARDLAQAIAPERDDVTALSDRVAALPQLAALIEGADDARAKGDLQDAEAGYADAVALDGAHRRAADSLASVRAEIVDRRFRGHMSRGYAALEGDRHDEAEAAFREAGKVRPGDESVARALAQVRNARSLNYVDRQMERAAEYEAREAWAEAVAAYEALLDRDPSLAEVRARLVPARVRAELDERLEGLLEDPLRLAIPAMYERGAQALADARGIGSPGERLAGQVERLDRALQLARSPVDVEFRSDNLTHVTLFRVADLGRFQATSLRLKPGRYVAAGSRSGFRDVRVEFTVTGEPLDAPIVVQCEEPI